MDSDKPLCTVALEVALKGLVRPVVKYIAVGFGTCKAFFRKNWKVCKREIPDLELETTIMKLRIKLTFLIVVSSYKSGMSLLQLIF